jgi:hypothetical protein
MIYAMDVAGDQAPDQHAVDRPTTWVSAAVTAGVYAATTSWRPTPTSAMNGAPSVGLGGKYGVR